MYELKRTGIRPGAALDDQHAVAVGEEAVVGADGEGVGAEPVVTPDVGIVASADILAADQACVDMVFAMKEEDHKALTERMLSRHSMRQLSYMKELSMGNDRYRLIDLDNDDAVIDAAKAVEGVVPFGQVRKIKYSK